MLFCIYGCASRLIITEAQSGPPNGIRVRETITCIVEVESIGIDASGNACTYTTEEITTLPIGITYDIDFLATPFAKAEFSVEVNDNGGVKKVTLNSTPQFSETIKAIGELATQFKRGELPPFGGCKDIKKAIIKSIRRAELTEKLKK
jgi:hypothetical protein